MVKIVPTVGRVVWYYERPPGDGDKPLAATITYVWDHTRVNLTVHGPNGDTYGRTSVYLKQTPHDVAEDIAGAYCEWMPYQLGQAAKTEQAEAVAQAARKGFEGR